jgi:hypothetical protein
VRASCERNERVLICEYGLCSADPDSDVARPVVLLDPERSGGETQDHRCRPASKVVHVDPGKPQLGEFSHELIDPFGVRGMRTAARKVTEHRRRVVGEIAHGVCVDVEKPRHPAVLDE